MGKEALSHGGTAGAGGQFFNHARLLLSREDRTYEQISEFIGGHEGFGKHPQRGLGRTDVRGSQQLKKGLRVPPSDRCLDHVLWSP